MSIFKLHSDYVPTGDQPQAIEKLTEGLAKGMRHQEFSCLELFFLRIHFTSYT